MEHFPRLLSVAQLMLIIPFLLGESNLMQMYGSWKIGFLRWTKKIKSHEGQWVFKRLSETNREGLELLLARLFKVLVVSQRNSFQRNLILGVVWNDVHPIGGMSVLRFFFIGWGFYNQLYKFWIAWGLSEEGVWKHFCLNEPESSESQEFFVTPKWQMMMWSKGRYDDGLHWHRFSRFQVCMPITRSPSYFELGEPPTRPIIRSP